MSVLEFGDGLRTIRLEHNLSLSHFAKVTEINVVELSKVERQRIRPSKEFMEKVRIKGGFTEDEYQTLEDLSKELVLKPPPTREEAIQMLPVFIHSSDPNFEANEETAEKLIKYIMEHG